MRRHKNYGGGNVADNPTGARGVPDGRDFGTEGEPEKRQNDERDLAERRHGAPRRNRFFFCTRIASVRLCNPAGPSYRDSLLGRIGEAAHAQERATQDHDGV